MMRSWRNNFEWCSNILCSQNLPSFDALDGRSLQRGPVGIGIVAAHDPVTLISSTPLSWLAVACP